MHCVLWWGLNASIQKKEKYVTTNFITISTEKEINVAKQIEIVLQSNNFIFVAAFDVYFF